MTVPSDLALLMQLTIMQEAQNMIFLAEQYKNYIYNPPLVNEASFLPLQSFEAHPCLQKPLQRERQKSLGHKVSTLVTTQYAVWRHSLQ